MRPPGPQTQRVMRRIARLIQAVQLGLTLLRGKIAGREYADVVTEMVPKLKMLLLKASLM